jgi:hypothetical protein
LVRATVIADVPRASRWLRALPLLQVMPARGTLLGPLTAFSAALAREG